ncbi:MAG: aminotransferase class V-fold PLP-dependent enzyme [Clostridia bacterium]|nr:aminotransferase class V-fold PLP-dependent enzyme [Clostridia bacterium]
MIYLDNAATTFPKPQCVSDEIIKCIKKYCGNPGRSSHKLSITSAEKIYETRILLSELFNAEPENVVFTYNTTYALNIAIKSLIKYSSHVLISDIEHNSVIRPIHELSLKKLCSYDVFSTDGTTDDIINSINSKIKKNTSLIVCTHVSNVGCRCLPIKDIGKICKENNIKFIVDGAQSAGIHNINIKEMNIDALCIPGHKGLYGPQGVGAIIYNNEKTERSIIQGGTGINSLELTMPNFLPERFEAGTLSTPCIAGLCESLKWLKKIGVENVKRHEEELYTLLVDLFCENNDVSLYLMNDYPGNTLLFNVNGISATTIANELNNRDICVRSGFHCSPFAHRLLKTEKSGAIRVSFSVFNTKNNIYTFFDNLTDIICTIKK